MSKRKVIFPANRRSLHELHGYSAAIRAGDLFFVSGQVGSLEDGSPEQDLGKQVEPAFPNLEAALTAAGAGFNDIVDVATFNTDPEIQFGVIMDVKTKFHPDPPHPTWKVIRVNWPAGFDFEIKVVVRPSSLKSERLH
jgi:enamine deaminase RidA (YjgF/YER057c/UK114 family)